MTQSHIQRQARALGDPTRNAIFDYIADAGHPVDVRELTDHFGLNHNAIRQHLTRLTEAGLVMVTTAPPSGRGRPRQLFEIHPAADERWRGDGPYQRISLMLVDMLKTGDSAIEVGRRTGRRIPVPAQQPIEDSLLQTLARGGFEPELDPGSDTAEFILHRCPFAETAAADPETVCALHLGMAQGLAERFQDVSVVGLEPRDPRRAGCRLGFQLAAV